MGEIIDMQAYRMRKTAERFLRSKGATVGMSTAADLLREKRRQEGRPLVEIDPNPPSILQHPAGRGRHE